MKLRLLHILFIMSVFLTNTYGQEKEATIDITGTVVSDAEDKSLQIKKGESIIGAIVKIKGQGKGTTTDIDGNFKLTNIPIGSVLEISYSGFKTQEIKVDAAKTDYSASLKVQSVELDPIVVTGYGTQKVSDVTGAVKRVTAEDMKATINTGLDQALQGRAAGINVTNNSGDPGSPASVNIRGVGSPNGVQPLYVVDGVPVSYENITMLNPSDVETMDVLKDASAAAIYGSRGANGVIMITTKRGKEGKSKVEFDAMVGVQDPWRLLDVMSPQQFKGYYADYYAKTSPTKNIDFYTKNLPGQGATNWQNESIRQGVIQNYNLSARGGNALATYGITLGYFSNTGVKTGTSFDRYSLRVNTDITPKKWLKFSESMSLSRTDNNSGGGVFAPLTANPLIPVYDPNNQPGGFAGPTNNTLFGTNNSINPVASNLSTQNSGYQTRALANVSGEVDFGGLLGVKSLEGLKWKTNVAADLMNNSSKQVNNPFFDGPSDRSVLFKSISQSFGTSTMWLVDHTLSYTKKIDKHEISAVIGMSSQNYYSESGQGSGQNYNPNLNQVGASLDPSTYIVTSGADTWGLLGYLGRINYVYDNKYLLTINARRDGSTRFGQNNQYGNFPSLSVGWRIINENFMKKAVWISDLKLRLGFGVTGNQDLTNVPGGNFLYNQVLYPDVIRYVIGQNQTLVSGQAPTTGYPNPLLQWERVTQWNAGIDFAVLRNSIILNIDAFYKQTSGALLPFPIPSNTGVSNAPFYGQPFFFENIGGIKNMGLELSLSYRNDNGPVKFSITPNGTFISNEVTSLDIPGGGDKPYYSNNSGLSYVSPGLPLGAFYGFVTNGIIQNAQDSASYVGNTGGVGQGTAHPGDIKFKDLNGDGKITDKDRTIIGSPIPTFSYGLTLDAKFAGFDLKIFLQGVQGVQVYNQYRIGLENMNPGALTGPDANQLTSVLAHWTPENHSNDMPRIVSGDPNQNIRNSTRFVENGSYMRIKNIQLGYTFNANFLKKALKSDDGISLRVYIQAQNLLTFTAYKGFDPELGSFSSTTGGIDNGVTPQLRTYSAGLQFSF